MYFGSKKSHPNWAALLSTHSICFGSKIRKKNLLYTLTERQFDLYVGVEFFFKKQKNSIWLGNKEITVFNMCVQFPW